MDPNILAIIISILGGVAALASTLIGMGLWLGRKLERIDWRFEKLEITSKRAHERLTLIEAEIEAWKVYKGIEKYKRKSKGDIKSHGA